MNIVVKKVTDISLMKEAVEFVFGVEMKASYAKWIKSGHTPIRTQWYACFCEVPYSVAMQMRTHDKNGALFLIESGRPDIGSAKTHTRDSIRKMFFMFNAQHIMDWSHKRLCNKAEDKTREFMSELKDKIHEIDPELSDAMIPMCKYRNGICGEFKPCNQKG